MAPIASTLMAGSLTYASPDGRRLVTETQLLPGLPAAEERMRGVITALIEGPATGLLNPWPREAALLDLFLAEDGVVYVNMSGSVRARLAPGDAMEWMLLASLTCTLCDNFPAVRGVRLLVDGESEGLLRRIMPLEWTYSPAMFTEAR
jgi:spore germination protein GerM